jgi:hypothetical protein
MLNKRAKAPRHLSVLKNVHVHNGYNCSVYTPEDFLDSNEQLSVMCITDNCSEACVHTGGFS